MSVSSKTAREKGRFEHLQGKDLIALASGLRTLDLHSLFAGWRDSLPPCQVASSLHGGGRR